MTVSSIMAEDDYPSMKKEEFTAEDLRNDVDRINKITLSWRFKMEFLPADREFAMFRRAVSHLEKSIKLVDSILMKFYGVSEEDLVSKDDDSEEDDFDF